MSFNKAVRPRHLSCQATWNDLHAFDERGCTVFLVRARRVQRWILAACLSLATSGAVLSGCNDGSTGCCMVCPECACGNSCLSCATRCTQPKGCACSSSTMLRARALEAPVFEPMSISPDAGEGQ